MFRSQAYDTTNKIESVKLYKKKKLKLSFAKLRLLSRSNSIFFHQTKDIESMKLGNPMLGRYGEPHPASRPCPTIQSLAASSLPEILFYLIIHPLDILETSKAPDFFPYPLIHP